MRPHYRPWLNMMLVLTWLTLLIVPSVSAASITVTPGETLAWFDVQASGFDSHEVVNVTLTGPSQQRQELSSLTTAANGDIAFNFRMARYEEPGEWMLTLLGDDSRQEMSASFNMPKLGPDIDLLMIKSVGPAGSRFDFHSKEFLALESVQYWLSGPDYKVYLSGRLEATALGIVDFTSLINERMPSGLWHMSAYGIKSNHLGIATFAAGGAAANGVSPIVAPPSSVTITAGDTPGSFVLRATGFSHQEDITTVASGPNQQQLGLPQQTTNVNGELTMDFRMPRYAELGNWTITLTGAVSERTVSTTMFMPLLGPDIEMMASPTGGAGATSYHITAGGFENQEAVTYWLVKPDYSQVALGSVDATRIGNVSFDIEINGALPGSTWMVYAYGNTSDHLGLVAITVG